MKKTTIIVMIVTIIAKIFGFLRDTLITTMFGVGSVSDAFTFAYSLPSMVFTVITATLVTGFIPMYSRVLREGKERANTFANNVFNILNLLAFVVGILFLLAPEFLVSVAATGFRNNPETLALATTFVRLMSFSIVGMAIAQIGTGYLNVHQSFIIPNLIAIPGNIIILICTVLAARTGQTWILGVGALSSYIFQGLIIFMQMRKVGFKYKPFIDFNDEHLKTMVTLSIPLLISALISTGNDMFTRSYATSIYDEGAFTYITYASRLQSFVLGLFVNGILSVAYPTITTAVVEKKQDRLIHSINDAILMLSLFVFPAMVGMLLMSEDIVRFVYATNDMFTDQNVQMLATILIGYVVGIFFVAIRDLFSRIHYAFQDMKKPLIGSVIYIVFNITGCIILGSIFGLSGLALATSIASFISMLFLIWNAKTNLGILNLKPIRSDFSKILIASGLMGVTVYFVNPLLQSQIGSQRIAVLGSIIAAVVVYLVAVLALRVQVVWQILKRKSS
ncbi:hypothetical protein AOC36_05720 [Erysipelothrix larvae]|uniref:Lipid II flippase n=1 Tax=Erysipelothrix larvae TaxID=1514105 RepID=A0A0X8H092_9FIRM|nr:murein biosynthesis integral membrane protein MurJ [Erysipelothrix larvae]AMC93494.1 hypothetical protein AOC36_05720 [Erysipelothrix larvae]